MAVPLLLAVPAQERPLALVARHPLLVGRDPGCDVLIADRYVSRHHLLVWYRDGVLAVRDCGSALGTQVGPRRLGAGESRPVAEGEQIVLAERIALTWAARESSLPAGWSPTGVVLRETGGWSVAGDADALGGSAAETTMQFRLTETTRPGSESVWIGKEAPVGDCSMTVSMEVGGPSVVRFEGPAGGTVNVRGDARVVLLFLLGQRRLLFDQGGCETPWVDDGALGVGLWGGRGTLLPPSRLNTVVARIRQQLEAGGLPRDIVEKRAGETRLGSDVGSIAIQGWKSGRVPAVTPP